MLIKRQTVPKIERSSLLNEELLCCMCCLFEPGNNTQACRKCLYSHKHKGNVLVFFVTHVHNLALYTVMMFVNVLLAFLQVTSCR